MIINKQYVQQLPVFSPCTKLSTSVLEYNGLKDKLEQKRSNIKRLSCHNISRDAEMQSEPAKEQPYFNNNKVLEHILGQIKQNYKNCHKHKEPKDVSISLKAQEFLDKQREQSQLLNYQNNLKIKSINNLIQRKCNTGSCHKPPRTPFQNKKLANLRKGKSYTLYTQEVETEPAQIGNQNKLLPWEQSSNHIMRFPGATHDTDEQNMDENYLKSHDLKLKQQRIVSKSIAFNMEFEKVPNKPSFKKYSTIEGNQLKDKGPNGYLQIFSTHCAKQRPHPKAYPNRQRKNRLNRTITEMKVEIDQIQLQQNQKFHARNIKLQEFFQCILPKSHHPRRHPMNHPLKHTQSFRRQSIQNISNSFLLSGKKL